jgi:hypothetical protein
MDEQFFTNEDLQRAINNWAEIPAHTQLHLGYDYTTHMKRLLEEQHKRSKFIPVMEEGDA